jgi:transposase InsO family protein
MHKNAKLTPLRRKEIYNLFINGKKVSTLAREFKVTRKIIYVVLSRARLRDFSVHNSTNHRFRQIFYGLKHLAKCERQIALKNSRIYQRYEKSSPGEMVHFDTKKLRAVLRYKKGVKTECLYVAIDDHSRYLFANILPDKNQESSALFLEELSNSVPFKIDCAYSDNGMEFKGSERHDFVWLCRTKHIEQKFTRVCRPQTNGKAERVIRTIMEECLGKRYYTCEERRKALREYVQYYNNCRPHSALKYGENSLTPCQVLEHYAIKKCIQPSDF